MKKGSVTEKTIKDKFNAKLVKNGNALAVNIPQRIIRKHSLKKGDYIDVNLEMTKLIIDENNIHIKGLISDYQSKKYLQKYDFNDLLIYYMVKGVCIKSKITIKQYFKEHTKATQEQAELVKKITLDIEKNERLNSKNN